MKIVTKKIMIRGKQYRLVTEVEGVICKTELPEQYIDNMNKPRFYMLDQQHISSATGVKYHIICFHTDDISGADIRISDSLDIPTSKEETFAVTEEVFQVFLKTVKEGIQNLKEVIASLPKWEGEETFYFN